MDTSNNLKKYHGLETHTRGKQKQNQNINRRIKTKLMGPGPGFEPGFTGSIGLRPDHSVTDQARMLTRLHYPGGLFVLWVCLKFSFHRCGFVGSSWLKLRMFLYFGLSLSLCIIIL